MKGVIAFLLFLEEFYYWLIGHPTLITLFIKTFCAGDISCNEIAFGVNPLAALILYSISVSKIVSLLKEILLQILPTRILLLIDDFAWIRFAMVVVVVLWALKIFMGIFSQSSQYGITYLYYNKSFWVILFGVWFFYKLLVLDAEDEGEDL